MSLSHIATRLLLTVSNPHGWQQFLDEKYEGGSKMVHNPNSATQNKFPEVAVSTALKDESFRYRIEAEYHNWYMKRKPKEPSGKSFHENLLGKYSVDDTLKEYKDFFNKGSAKSSQQDKVMKRLETDLKIKLRDAQENVEYYQNMINDGSSNPALHKSLKKTQNLLKAYQDIEAETKKVNPVLIHGMKEYFQPQAVPSSVVKKLTQAWLGDSNQKEAGYLQKFLSDKGVKGTEYTDYYKPIEGFLPETFDDDLAKAYVYQQAVFKHMGITHIDLYRGVRDRSINDEPPMHGEKVSVKTREASSWSSNPAVAARFGTRMIKSKVPVEHIILSSITSVGMDGNSKMGESEYVVMGAESLDCEVFSSPYTLI
jgi:hypothetical protein